MCVRENARGALTLTRCASARHLSLLLSRHMRYAPSLALDAGLALSAFAPAHIDGTIGLDNESSSTIMFLYASPCEQDTWGDDLLPVDVLEPGASATITMTPGCWDLRAVTDSEESLEHFGVVVEESEHITWTIEDAE